MKWKKRGRSSIQSKKRGQRKKISGRSACSQPVRGAPKKPTNFSRATAAPGGDCKMPAETFSPGIAVEIGKIDRELKKLWADGAGVKTRASLINLAIYSDAPGSLPQNTRLISEITEDHACRAIVIEANLTAKENRVEAWINVH